MYNCHMYPGGQFCSCAHADCQACGIALLAPFLRCVTRVAVGIIAMVTLTVVV